MSECDRMVRASSNLGSEDVADSQDATLDNVRLPLADLGEEIRSEDISADILARACFSSSTMGTGLAVGLEGDEPIV